MNLAELVENKNKTKQDIKQKARDDAARQAEQWRTQVEAFRKTVLDFLAAEVATMPKVTVTLVKPTVDWNNEIALIQISQRQGHAIEEHALFVSAGYEKRTTRWADDQPESDYWSLEINVTDSRNNNLIYATDVDSLREKFAEWLVTL